MRVLAWCLACKARKWINEHLFRAYLYTVCVYFECESQGDENLSAELDDSTRMRGILLRSRHAGEVA